MPKCLVFICKVAYDTEGTKKLFEYSEASKFIVHKVFQKRLALIPKTKHSGVRITGPFYRRGLGEAIQVSNYTTPISLYVQLCVGCVF